MSSQAPTLLLVEDDPRIRQALGLALGDEGYGVVEAATGEQALAALEDGPGPDLVLLDIRLPGIDGIEVCRRIRERGDLPIIMVTARTDTADVIAGLEAGADDYVTKPLVAPELSARVRALLRRAHGEERAAQQRVMTAGDVELDPVRGVVTRGGEVIHVTKTEYRLLYELLAAQGGVVSREQLLDRVWGYGYFGDTRLLDVHVRRLRRKVEPDPSAPTLVLTVRGVGYRVAL